MEKPFFFDSATGPLFGMLHEPVQARSKKAVLICHAFGEEKLWSHRVLVSFAREAARRNFTVLRFDFSGHGDSYGSTNTVTPRSFLTNIEAAHSVLTETHPHLERISLVGLRLGATIAATYASKPRQIHKLVMWEPILNGARYLQELLRINLSTQLATKGKIEQNREDLATRLMAGEIVNVDGYLINRDFFEEMSEIDLLSPDLELHTTESLIVPICSTNNQKVREEFHSLADSGHKRQLIRAIEPPFWREIKPFVCNTEHLTNLTLDWIGS